MRSRLLIAFLCFTAGGVLGALYSPIRYTITASPGSPLVYRLDRFTGTVCVSAGLAGGWREVPAKYVPAVGVSVP